MNSAFHEFQKLFLLITEYEDWFFKKYKNICWRPQKQIILNFVTRRFLFLFLHYALTVYKHRYQEMYHIPNRSINDKKQRSSVLAMMRGYADGIRIHYYNKNETFRIYWIIFN